MAHALALGRRGFGNVWPNPAVGCVIMAGGRVVGRGWTQPGGRPHAEAMARVEIGHSRIPTGYRLRRPDADEVFRTLAVEPVVDRRHNPGLDDDHVESIIATCCVILGVMRRLDLDSIGVTAGPAGQVET